MLTLKPNLQLVLQKLNQAQIASKASDYIGLEPLSVSRSRINVEVQGSHAKDAQIGAFALPARIERVMSEGTPNHVYERPTRVEVSKVVDRYRPLSIQRALAKCVRKGTVNSLRGDRNR